MSTYLKLPTGLTFSDIREGLPSQSLPALNEFLAAIGQPAVSVGDNNPLVLRLNDFDMGGAAFLRGNAMDDPAFCGPIANIAHIPGFYIELMVEVGGDLLSYPCDFEITDPAAEVPATFPNRTFEQPDDLNDPESSTTTVVHTWQTWGAETRPDLLPEQIDGKWYRSNKNPYQSDNGFYTGVGIPLDASVWVAAGLSPVTKPVPEVE